jgi:hypothetical protein
VREEDSPTHATGEDVHVTVLVNSPRDARRQGIEEHLFTVCEHLKVRGKLSPVRDEGLVRTGLMLSE